MDSDHGWSSVVDVHHLASDATVTDEKRARYIARNQLAGRPSIGLHQGKAEIWLQGPPSDDVCYARRDMCGYHPLQIEATFDAYVDGCYPPSGVDEVGAGRVVNARRSEPSISQWLVQPPRVPTSLAAPRRVGDETGCRPTPVRAAR